jgi:DNA modification methylase
MTAHYEDGPVQIWHGDCIDVMRGMPDQSVDAVVTDPPYGLEFMGKDWDAPWQKGDDVNTDAGFGALEMADGYTRLPKPSYTSSTNPKCSNCGGTSRGRRDGTAARKVCTCDQPRFPNVRATEMRAFQAWCRLWAAEAYRLLKPGGHLLAFGGTRTHHRLASGIEDAGFEIRDSIFWAYGSGFPKSLNVTDALGRIVPDDARCACGPRSTRTAPGSPAGYPSSHGSGDAQPRPARAADRAPAPSRADAPGHTRAGQRPDVLAAARASSGPGAGTGRLATADSTDPWELPSAVDLLDASAPSGTRTNTSAGPETATRRTDDRTPSSFDLASVAPSLKCDRCGYVTIPQGFGTALKPAAEPIVVARKPLTGTVAANVLTYGTGALNIDGSRIGTQGGAGDFLSAVGDVATVTAYGDGLNGAKQRDETARGRWPANVVLDASQAAALDQQSGDRRSAGDYPSDASTAGLFGQRQQGQLYADTGGASRFFYTAKASTDERPSVDGVAHPTVKPVDLMRWLVKLVTPPGGIVLEPFAGSGTTVEACVLEGFRCIAIEREGDYLPLILQRIRKPHAVGLDLGGWDDTPAPKAQRGRWPANVVLSESQAEQLDEQSGITRETAHVRVKAGGVIGNGQTHGAFVSKDDRVGGVTDEGGASRFFKTVPDPEPVAFDFGEWEA